VVIKSLPNQLQPLSNFNNQNDSTSLKTLKVRYIETLQKYRIKSISLIYATNKTIVFWQTNICFSNQKDKITSCPHLMLKKAEIDNKKSAQLRISRLVEPH